MGTIHLLLVLVTIQDIAAGRADALDDWGDDKLQIYNGEEAAVGEFPFMVRIKGPDGSHWCGGSLIKPRIVLTAAHCVVEDDVVVKNLRVVVGDWHVNEAETVEEEYETERSIVHPGYQDMDYDNDLALIVLKEQVQYKDGVGSIALPEDRSFYETGTPITVIGWGGTQDGEESNTLQKLEYEISDQDACKDFWEKEQQSIEEGMVCTGKPPLEGHAWAGDSGGPLFTKDGDKFVLLALTSWGVGEPSSDAFDVNTDVHFYKDWILENAEKALDDRWIELQGALSHGVVLFHDKSEVFTACNEGVGKDEVDAICRHLGYTYGVLRLSVEYQGRSRKIKPALPQFGITNLKCNSESENVLEDCSTKKYPDEAAVPCFDGQQLAVQCTDTEWEFAVEVMTTNLKKADSNTVKGKVECMVDAKQYGTVIDLKGELQVALVNVHEEGVEYVKEEMRFKKRHMMFTSKLKTGDEIEHNCFVCVASLRGTNKFFTAKVEVEDCKMDSSDALQAVTEWMESKEEETGEE